MYCLGTGGRLALRVADAGIFNYPDRAQTWPCGTQGGESLSLFLGLAAIGLFYLQLVEPRIPSVLIPMFGVSHVPPTS